MAKVIMIQGTMSNAGKSLLTAGLCRIMKQDGYRVAPFKSQNMALNSFITKEGLEMGRAQVMQAEAAGLEPMVCMNPILLKPTNHTGSQVIVNGEIVGNMDARDYFSYKTRLIPHIKSAFRKLEQIADVIVIEGAGSPAEINLRENDIVNMGLAELVDAPVLLVGDIDRGGVFAQLLGTLMLLSEEEKKRVKGLIINKFRGDKTILDSGIDMLEEKGKVPVVGVIPYMELSLEDEDSLTGRFEKRTEKSIDIAVVRYPRISNFTDMNVFEQNAGVSVRYVASVTELGVPDMKIPIQYALLYPERVPCPTGRLSLTEYGSLTFEKPDYETFKCLSAAIEAIKRGGAYPCLVNSANEEAVRAFLNDEISFISIGEIVSSVLDEFKPSEIRSYDDVMKADSAARAYVREKIGVCAQ